MEGKRKFLFDLIRSKFFDTLQVSSINGVDVTQSSVSHSTPKVELKEDALLVSPSKTDFTCRTCSLSGFASIEEFRTHYKSNFHR